MSAPVEPKVKAATGGGAVAGFVLYLIAHYAFGGNDVPEVVEAAVSTGLPALGAFVSGYVARHQYRQGIPDGTGRHRA